MDSVLLSFRNWSHNIIRNQLFLILLLHSRNFHYLINFDEMQHFRQHSVLSDYEWSNDINDLQLC